MKRSLDQLAEIAREAIRIGSNTIKNTRPESVTQKSDRDSFTDVDLKIERSIRNYLSEITPEIRFAGEEEGEVGEQRSGRFMWTLDPIDGTANFVHGIPLCAVQIALMHNGEALVAAIELPYMGMHYWAAKEHGAYANESRIQCSTTDDLSKSIVSIGDYATGEHAEQKNLYRISKTAALANRVERIRMFGSAAHDLAWVAEGRIDAAVIMSNKVHDIAGGVLIAREAGACVTDTKGSSHTPESLDTVASSPRILNDLLNLL
ncbi:myo-inositol-1(or 4)-monophosphatase [Saccharothrix saharensis]|uniref:Myo-inositol-1(Or 4)-monophosphatase n=1 Tax=Saccharothrix saharensis TaxID=571190 RepID=A0A543JK11_9PSEU|nr:inositol monophosphatase family protein [Saccharothrix saharensis]TQM83192.1 myo-inositol-1(or 4)-monophosphatase [Saccharothrix saharensis]